MIIKNSKEIRKIYVGSTPTPSLNYNGSKAWQHILDESSPSVDCPDVVQTMDGYEGDAKEVYAKGTEKWYMRNNLGNYEEYGILDEVQTLDSATFYEGKLVIFGNHEYESIGGNWVDLGAAQDMYPKDYEAKDAPEDNVTVESLDQIECPYEGMTAYVNGVRYVYTGGEWVVN